MRQLYFLLGLGLGGAAQEEVAGASTFTADNVVAIYPNLDRSKDRRQFQENQWSWLGVYTERVEATTPTTDNFHQRCLNSRYDCAKFIQDPYYKQHSARWNLVNWATAFSTLDSFRACAASAKDWCVIVEDDSDMKVADGPQAAQWWQEVQSSLAALPTNFTAFHLCSAESMIAVRRFPGRVPRVLGEGGWPAGEVWDWKGLLPSAPIALVLRRAHAGEYAAAVDAVMSRKFSQMDFLLRDLYTGVVPEVGVPKAFHAGAPQLCGNAGFTSVRAARAARTEA